MFITHMVVSCPPYEDTLAPQAAPLLGLGVYDAKLFLRYPLPEILRVASSPESALAAAAPFKAAHMEVDIVPQSELERIPAAAQAVSFAFENDAVRFTTTHNEFHCVVGSLRLMVSWEYDLVSKGPAPMSGPGFSPMRALAEAGTKMAFGEPVGHGSAGRSATGGPVKTVLQMHAADLYAIDRGRLTRVGLDQGSLDFSGLGGEMKPGGVANWRALVARLKRLAPGMVIDDILEQTKPRKLAIDRKWTMEAQEAEGSEFARRLLMDHKELYSLLSARRLCGEHQ
ncbi:MAG: hypothetical protein RDV41_15640 [Planctomycetota bacterium]|nr:hypothetical protein [Planctomycetota bacterium]